jgi:D-sedoheptulose 7-phosphate isomerase
MRLDEHLARSAALLAATRAAIGQEAVDAAIAAIVAALGASRPLLVCGNGGSAADAMHIAAELVGRFRLERPALPVICLSANAAVLTAWANDYAYETVLARQVEAHGGPGTVLLGLSTSGSSPSMLRAFETARRLGMVTVALTGEGGGRLAPLTDHLLAVPSRDTPLIQQVHVCLYHYICEAVEAALARG